MKEFTAKKLGEVLAFSRVGILMVQKSGPAIAEALGEGEEIKLAEELKGQASKLEEIAISAGAQEITLPKAEKTGAKLTSMMELYVGEEWENPSEIMEWMGFFEGSAIVHWQIVSGSASSLGNKELINLSEEAIKLHKETFSKVSEALYKIGSDRTV